MCVTLHRAEGEEFPSRAGTIQNQKTRLWGVSTRPLHVDYLMCLAGSDGPRPTSSLNYFDDLGKGASGDQATDAPPTRQFSGRVYTNSGSERSFLRRS
jgi:hypothetical protein